MNLEFPTLPSNKGFDMNPTYETTHSEKMAEMSEKLKQAVDTKNAQLTFKRDLEAVIIGVQTMLIDKNAKYGDAALNPNQTFSRCDSLELINVRIDDKLSRIRNRKDNEDEDVEMDLIGYLILKQIAKRRLSRSELEKELNNITIQVT